MGVPGGDKSVKSTSEEDGETNVETATAEKPVLLFALCPMLFSVVLYQEVQKEGTNKEIRYSSHT